MDHPASRDLPRILDVIRQQTALVRGTMHGTMLRNDIYDFARIGTYLERADNTARILDVKYYVLLPSAAQVTAARARVDWRAVERFFQKFLKSMPRLGGSECQFQAKRSMSPASPSVTLAMPLRVKKAMSRPALPRWARTECSATSSPATGERPAKRKMPPSLGSASQASVSDVNASR